MSMAKAIVNLELKDLNWKLLGEQGITLPLLEMLSGSIESKELSLSALVKLARLHANKGIIHYCNIWRCASCCRFNVLSQDEVIHYH